MGKNVVMIHGMFAGAWVWDEWFEDLEERGYTCIAPTLRHHDVTPPREPYPDLGDTSLLDFANDLEREVSQLDDLPVIIAHSMGSIPALKLASWGLARALVLLAPAPPSGIWALTPSMIRPFLSAFAQWGFWRKPFLQTFKEATVGGLYMLPPERQRRLFSKYTYESGRAICEIGFSFLDLKKASHIPSSQVDCPVLVVAGSEDRMTPASVVRRIAARYSAAYREFPGMAHWLVAGPWFQEVGPYVVSWLQSTLDAERHR